MASAILSQISAGFSHIGRPHTSPLFGYPTGRKAVGEYRQVPGFVDFGFPQVTHRAIAIQTWETLSSSSSPTLVAISFTAVSIFIKRPLIRVRRPSNSLSFLRMVMSASLVLPNS